MDNKVLDTLSEYQMLQKNDNVIVALSGGADSVTLFHFFVRYAKQLEIQISAAHFNHGLRGEESDADAVFVEQLCRQYRVPLFIEHARMNQLDKPRGLSTETWARQLRYAFLERLAQSQNAKVATAHTLNDQAETLLFHAVRGSGPKGLAGIPAARDYLIRPLLPVTREEIEEYCKMWSLPFVNDGTNTNLEYSRNRIRHKVIPELKQVHPGTLNALSRLAKDMRELDIYLEQEAVKLFPLQDPAANPAAISFKKLGGAPGPVRLKALSLMAGPRADRACLERIDRIVRSGKGAVQITQNREARIVGPELVIQKPVRHSQTQGYQFPFKEGTFSLPGGYLLQIFRIETPQDWEKIKNSGKKDYTFMADYDRMFKCDSLRTRLPGDFFSPAGRGVTKSLKKWFNEQKVPVEKRARLPILVCEHQVLWIWGGGLCEGLQAKPGTPAFAIQTSMIGEEDHREMDS